MALIYLAVAIAITVFVIALLFVFFGAAMLSQLWGTQDSVSTAGCNGRTGVDHPCRRADFSAALPAPGHGGMVRPGSDRPQRSGTLGSHEAILHRQHQEHRADF